MQIIIGPPATGSDFFPRSQITERLQRALKAEHVLFLAPRRTGKTSVLLNLRNHAVHPAVFLDLEGFNHPKYWIEAMAGALSEMRDQPWLRTLKNAEGVITRLQSEVLQITEADWMDKATRLMNALEDLEAPVWFLLDEFPVMIDKIAITHGKEMASTTMGWMRRLRQQNTGSPVRFLLTGSIGLDAVLRHHGIRGPANDLRREFLTPLPADEALELALRLARDNHVPLNESLAREYIERLGPARWPFFIQLFVAELQDAGPTPEQPADLDRIYQAVAYGRRNQYADNMWTRLREVFTESEAAIAREVLRTVAGAAAGVFPEDIRARLPNVDELDFDYVLEALGHDGYLAEADDGRILFFSNLLRDFWRRKGWA